MRRMNFDHLIAITDHYGTFEHAEFSTPRREHGYCVDDVARVLVVIAREPSHRAPIEQLAVGALAFLRDSMGLRGEVRNRRSADGRWMGHGSVEDCWGRALWGLGTAASSNHGSIDDEALRLFERGATQRSSWPRAMAFATLGAVEVLRVERSNRYAIELLDDAAGSMPDVDALGAWPWPESRLAYANAVLPDAMMAAGVALGRPELVRRGLGLLGWLLARETRDGHLSVTPVGGAGPLDTGPHFDQQPIEIATLADACARAATLDDSPAWLRGVRMADAWFDGDNDSQIVMWDPTTGGGFDGLGEHWANLNQGAESTLALLSTRQHALLRAAVLS
jgi:hypothetical protein